MFAKAKAMANDVANKVQEGATLAGIEGKLQYTQHQIDNLKAAWGKAAFDLALAGDFAAVGNLAMGQKTEKERLDAKMAELRQQRDAIKGGTEPAATTAATSVQTMTVVVPQGASPGGMMAVQVPDGAGGFNMCNVTVPPGAAPGSQITVEVPLNATPIVQGTPIA